MELKSTARALGVSKWGSPQTPTLAPASRLLLSTCLLLLVGTWRHRHLQNGPTSLRQEVWIEWLSWVIIFVTRRALDVPKTTTDTCTLQTPSFWTSRFAPPLACVAAVISQLLSSQGVFAAILPLVTLVVTTIVPCSSAPVEQENKEVEGADSLPAILHISSEAKDIEERSSLPAAIVLNVICFALLFKHGEMLTQRNLMLNSFLFLLSRSGTVIFISKLQLPPDSEQVRSTKGSTMQCLGLLSMPMLSLLTLLLVIMPPNLETSSMKVIGRALAQAAWWFAIVTVIRFRLTNTAANLDTMGFSIQFAVAGSDMSSFAQALSVMLLSIGQAFIAIRLGTAIRRVIYMLVALLVLGLYIRQGPDFTTTTSSNKIPFSVHPVEYLVTQSRAKLDDLLSRQSKNVDEAVAEYQRRYGRQPPRAFDQWFTLAVQNDFVLIDEFDTLMAGLEPFRGVHPFILEQRLEHVMKSDAKRLFVMEFADGNMTMSGKLRNGDELVDMTWLEIVPYNMTIALNIFDESMVNAPWDVVEQAVGRARNHERYPEQHETKESTISPLLDTGQQNGWAATGRACPLHSPSRQFECLQRQATMPISFVSNVTASKDVCQNCELLQEEGLLLSPWNMRLAHDLVPIWSASRLSHFHDILYPSAYYIAVRDDYAPEMDIPWDDKDNKFYWAGGDTGGWASGETWNHMQRQRLVLKTKQRNKDPIQLLEELEPGSNRWSPRFSSMAEVVDLFATHISYVMQCTDEACLIEKAAFGLEQDRDLVPPEDSYSHKFVLDVDGNGFSGRFYRLLRPRSVVMKQTLMKEWHDDRLMPWVHYIPVSTGYSELPELARFLATTDKGLELSERIARESTEWHDKALRDVDISLVFLRMLLEYGRIMNPDTT